MHQQDGGSLTTGSLCPVLCRLPDDEPAQGRDGKLLLSGVPGHRAEATAAESPDQVQAQGDDGPEHTARAPLGVGLRQPPQRH